MFDDFTTKIFKKNKEKSEVKIKRANLESFMNISTKNDLQTFSEIGWITKEQFILTLNNAFYLINLRQKDMIRVINGIWYGKQQVNMNLFCSITRKSPSKKVKGMDNS